MCVQESTRMDNLLDIVCLNEPVLLHAIETLPPFGLSDHTAVSFSINVRHNAHPNNASLRPIPTPKTTYLNDCVNYNWLQGDYESMSMFLSNVRWHDILTVNFTADTMWNCFRAILDDAIDRFIPHKAEVQGRCRRSRRPRRPRVIHRLLNKKLSLYRQYRTRPADTGLRTRYNQACAKYKLSVRTNEIEKERKVLDANNPGSFYKYVNSKLTCKSGIGTLVNSNGDDITDDDGKANLLNDYFVSVCTNDDGLLPQMSNTMPPSPSIDSISFDPSKIIKMPKKVKSKCKTSLDPEGYPTILISKLINVLSEPLTLLFNSFMSIGKLPSTWKTATVTPIFKKGPASNPANYRPISKTSIFCKLMERVIVSDLSTHFDNSKILNNSQHGFSFGKSTLTNLLESITDWTLAIDNKRTQTVAYVDFSRAFDTVSHPKLIYKLKLYGISGCLLSLISDFLSNRKQVTQVGSGFSDIENITSGVVQGSCLGPFLFLLFINDLPQIFNSLITSKLYADDVKLYAYIKTLTDEFSFQENLNRLEHWAKSWEWELTISIMKCCLLQINNIHQNSLTTTPYFLLNSILTYEDNVRDLGNYRSLSKRI